MEQKGKLESLITAFERVGEGDDPDLLKNVVIGALEEHNWNPNLAAMSMVIFAGGTELNTHQSDFLLALLIEKANSLPKNTPNDRQKVDLIIKCLELGNPDSIDLGKLKALAYKAELEELASNKLTPSHP